MDAWICNLSDGSTRVEEWIDGELSPWQRLMAYCKKNNAYVTNLRLTMGSQTVSCLANAKGYWQAHGMPSVQGIECDEELHKWRGIGWVEGDNIHIIWGARDPRSHQVVFWHDSRPAKNQAQVIWARPSLPSLDTRGEAQVRGIREFGSRIVSNG